MTAELTINSWVLEYQSVDSDDLPSGQNYVMSLVRVGLFMAINGIKYGLR